MSKNKKSGGILTAVQIIVYLLLGFFLGFNMQQGLENRSLLQIYLPLFASLLIAMYFQIILHELGHLVFGIATGYKFSSFRISSFTFVKGEDGRLKFRLMRIPGTAGQCLLVPPEQRDGKIPFVLYNMGGVITNVIASVLILALKLTFGVDGFLGDILLCTSLVGFAFAITNGVPMKNKLICNDGMNTLAIHKSEEANSALYNMLMLAFYQSKGYRMKDIPADYFSYPTDEGMQNCISSSGAVFMADRAIDFGFFDQALEMTNKALSDGDGIIGSYRRVLLSNRLYLSLMAGRPVLEIEAMLDAEMRKLLRVLPYAMFGVYTAYAYEKLYLGNVERASQIRKRFESKSKTYPYKGEIEAAKELMNRVDTQFNIWHGIENM